MRATMPLLVVSGVLALLFILIGLLAGLGLRLFGVRGKARRVARITAIAFLVFLPAFVFLIAPVVLSQLIANASTRPMDRLLKDTPSTWGAAYQETAFSTPDGLELRAWFLPGDAARPVFAVTHGLFRNRQEVLQRSCDLNRAGFPVLLFDLRNHGQSAHKHVSLGFEERLDFLGAYDYLQTRLPGQPIVFQGVSMGAVAAIEAASDLSAAGRPLRALVADSPFLSLDDTVRRHVRLFLNLPAFPFVDVFIWNLTRINGFEASELDVSEAIRRLSRTPVLLIYGTRDPRMPPDLARSLTRSAAHSTRLLFFEGAAHGAAYDSDPERYIQVILDFLRE